MRLIAEYTTTNDVETWDHVAGIEYESAAAFKERFDELMLENLIKKDRAYDDYFVLGGRKFYPQWFTYNDWTTRTTWQTPDVYTVDEWFEKESEADD